MKRSLILTKLYVVLLGLLLGMIFVLISGESPLAVLKILFLSVFGSTYDLGMTLFYSVPLMFTGISVSIAYRAGLFNIGAEGQLTIGAFAMAAFGLVFPDLLGPVSPFAAIFVGFLAGGFWGWIPGYLRSRFGSHEVITTIMMNFIAFGIVSYFTLYHFRNSETQNPETKELGASYLFDPYSVFDGAPLGFALVFALAAVISVHFFFKKTTLGYEIYSVGENPEAALRSGVNSKQVLPFAMFLAGGAAAMVGVSEVLGNSGKFVLGFSPGYGFIGIAVALLAGRSAVGIVFSALLFGALHKGTADLDFEFENITRDLSLILQACVIIGVVCESLFKRGRKS